MKTTILLAIISIFICMSSCKKDTPVVATNSDFTAIKNDESWTSTTSWANYSKTEHKFYVNATKHHTKFYQEEQLSISFEMPDLTQPLTVTKLSSQWYSIIGGDALADSYYIDSSADNQVQITSVDPEKKIISGTFKIRLIRDQHYSGKGKAFQVVQGRFSLEYNEIE